MLHYHGTPITPISALYELAGRHFCVSHARPDDVARAHQIGQSVLLDNGAFSKWKRGAETDWPAYYDWCDRWLSYPTTWAIIPDVIDGGSQLQDALLREWPYRHRGAPVWHMDEPVERLLRLVEEWPRVCVGSTGEYAVVMSPSWQDRMDECWDAHRRSPPASAMDPHAPRDAVFRPTLALRVCRQHRHRAKPSSPLEYAARHGRPVGCSAVPGAVGVGWASRVTFRVRSDVRVEQAIPLRRRAHTARHH